MPNPGNLNAYNVAPDYSGPVDYKRKLAFALLQQGADASPVQHWTQGAARLAQALAGAYGMYSADEEDRQQRQASAKALVDSIVDPQANQPGGGGSVAVPVPPPAPPQTPTQAPAQPASPVPPQGKALLAAISGAEAPSYNTLYGGGTFQGYEDHPRQPVPITSGPMAGKASTAAGKYQFLAPTWDQQKTKLGLTDFSPANQDAAAWDLAATTYRRKTGGDLATDAQNPQNAGKIADALSSVWPSLPGGGQPNKLTGGFQSRLVSALGAPTPDTVPVAATGAVPSPPAASAAPPPPVAPPVPPGAAPPMPPLSQQPGSPAALNTAGGMTAQQVRAKAAQMISAGPAGAAAAQDLIKKWNESQIIPNDSQKSAEFIKQNWQQLGFSGPDDPRLAALVRQRLSGLNTPPQETEQEKAIGTYYGGMFKTIGEDARNARSSNSTLGTMEQIAKSPNFRSGIGAETETFWRRGIAAFGGEKALKDLGLDPKSAAPNEAFRALSNKAVYDTLGSLGAGISNGDRSFIENVFPNLLNTPDGNALIIKVMKRMNDRKIEIGQMARGYNQGRLDTAFEDKLDTLASKPLFNKDEMKELTETAARPPVPTSADQLKKKYDLE